MNSLAALLLGVGAVMLASGGGDDGPSSPGATAPSGPGTGPNPKPEAPSSGAGTVPAGAEDYIPGYKPGPNPVWAIGEAGGGWPAVRCYQNWAGIEVAQLQRRINDAVSAGTIAGPRVAVDGCLGDETRAGAARLGAALPGEKLGIPSGGGYSTAGLPGLPDLSGSDLGALATAAGQVLDAISAGQSGQSSQSPGWPGIFV